MYPLSSRVAHSRRATLPLMPLRAMHLRRSVGMSALACTASRSISPSSSDLTGQAYAAAVEVFSTS
jgi:hypothetical protein